MAEEWRKSRTLLEATGHALAGVRQAFWAERNIRIQLVISLAAVLLGVVVGLPTSSLAIIVLVAASLLCLELINTALENLSNVVSPHYHEVLRNVKDMAAGAVLVASIGAVIIGLLLFIPALV